MALGSSPEREAKKKKEEARENLSRQIHQDYFASQKDRTEQNICEGVKTFPFAAPFFGPLRSFARSFSLR